MKIKDENLRGEGIEKTFLSTSGTCRWTWAVISHYRAVLTTL